MTTLSQHQEAVEKHYRVAHRVLEEPHGTAQAFFNALDLVDTRWTPAGASQSRWIFRGQVRATDGLVPSAWRPDGDAAKLISAAKDQWVATHGPASSPWDLQCKAEQLLLGTWIGVAARDGYQLPRDTPAADELGPEASHAVATLARHHRLPSALLDFTRRPEVAMFWAVDEVRLPSTASLAVWAVEEGGWTGAQVHNHERWGNANLLAQDGVTVQAWMADHFLAVVGRLPGLEECKGIAPEQIRKLVLPHSEAPALRRLLELRGVTRSRLEPGYYGVTETVLARHRR